MNIDVRQRGPETAAPAKNRLRRWVILGVVVLVVAALLVVVYVRSHDSTEAARQRRAFGQPVPVAVAPAAIKDIPIYLDGLGTVQAFYTVTVHSMIDGPLLEVGFREGQDLHPGDVLARIDPRPYQATLDQAIAKKAQDEATLANARLDLARYNKLAATAYTSAQTADTARATVAQNEALVKQDQASIDSARTQLSYTTISSPIEGRAGIRQVDAGNIIHASDSTGLVVITTIKPISVIFTLPQQALPQITAAMADQTAKLEVQALPQGDIAGQMLDRGQLEVVDNQVDSTTGTIKLKARFPNPRLTLWPGGFVNVRLLVTTARDVVTVPPVAVQRGPQGTFVYVLGDDETVSRRTITVGHEDLRASIVTAGLKPGEEVVIDGASRLTDKAKVAVNDGKAPETTEAAPPRRRRREAKPNP